MLLLTGCGSAGAASRGGEAASATAESDAHRRLQALFKQSDKDDLRRNPLNAIARGDLRHADQLGDLFSDAYYAAERAAAERDLRALAAIDRTALSATDRIACDVFEHQARIALRGLAPDLLALRRVLPISHFSGIQKSYPDFASGQGAAPFRTVEDYDNNLKRHHQFPAVIDRVIARFRQGMASGVVNPKLVVTNMIDQLDLLVGQGVDGSTFNGPVRRFPSGIPAAEQQRLRAAHAAAIRDEIRPALERLRDFLHRDYLPVARDGVGLVHMPGGPALYRFLIEENTTVPLTADDVHALGLAEVARIRREMEEIKLKVGFAGSLGAFFEHLRTDPKFQPPSKEWVRDEYYAIGKRVDARVGELFAVLPSTPLEIRPVPDYREKTDAGGSYNEGTPDGSRAGVFYFNTYDLPSRTTPGMETLYLHEASPGHHFQISLAQENAALPNFMRFGGNTAFIEGWALYAETLWDELGMETDPYQRFGGLNDEMLRAMRLVVDSGIHAQGWTREQAIRYMLDNSSMGRTDATAEVERYIAIPGQALAYKVGQLKLLELRANAEKTLGAKFDIREFHGQVLGTGTLPLTVLTRKIEAWVAAEAAR